MALAYVSYKEAKEKFDWSERWSLFDGTNDRFNIGHECVDRQPKNEVAIRIKFEDGRTETYTFAEFSKFTSQFANLLEHSGIGFGDRVALLLFPSIEFYVSMFGIFKRGAVVVPCFPLFGPDAVAFRLEKSGATAIVTTKDMVASIDPAIVTRLGLKFIFAEELMEKLSKEEDSYDWQTNANSLCMMQFSSGPPRAPKSVMYKHNAITAAAVVMKFGVGLGPDDVYFCPSSPAWGHGIWYGTISPLIFGKAIGTFSGKFDAEKCLEAMAEWKVTVMAAISSHYRLILESGKCDLYKLPLKKISYTGEAMTQSLGKPMIGGVKVAVLDEQGKELPPGEIGEVALWKEGKWIRIGDSAYVDEDGYFWYISRIDDVIISAGSTTGPIEVEGSLMKHPAVEECAVVGSPDKDRGDLVKAFIKLKAGYEPAEALAKEIQAFVKNRLSTHEYPREIEFIDELPKTPDGKIKRKELKQREREKKLGS